MTSNAMKALVFTVALACAATARAQDTLTMGAEAGVVPDAALETDAPAGGSPTGEPAPPADPAAGRGAGRPRGEAAPSEVKEDVTTVARKEIMARLMAMSGAEFASLGVRAKDGDAEAAYLLGTAFGVGYGVPLDDEAALEWFKRAAEQRYRDAEQMARFFAGRIAAKSMLRSEMVVERAQRVLSGELPAPATIDADLLRMAERGDAEAQVALGRMHAMGRGAPQNYATAVRWYETAARQGSGRALYHLGMLHYEGEGVPQNLARAAELFTQGAEAGDVASQVELGIMLFAGELGARNPVEGLKWLVIASSGGDEGATRKRDKAAALVDAAQSEEAVRRARDWLSRRVAKP